MGVDAQLLTNVLARRTLVQIAARAVVRVQQEAGGTAARVAALQVLTRHLARRRVQQALVHVCDGHGGIEKKKKRIIITCYIVTSRANDITTRRAALKNDDSAKTRHDCSVSDRTRRLYLLPPTGD